MEGGRFYLKRAYTSRNVSSVCSQVCINYPKRCLPVSRNRLGVCGNAVSGSPTLCSPSSTSQIATSCPGLDGNGYAVLDDGGNSGGNRTANKGYGRGDSDGNQPQSNLLLHPVILGAAVLITALAIFPPPSQATPGWLSISQSKTSTSAGLGASLERTSLGAPSSGQSLGSPSSSTSSSPLRPRSKIMHVPCKGGTLVVPMSTSADGKVTPVCTLPRMPLWQRGRIVDAPVQLTEAEARLVKSRQNRVRDSMYVS